MKFTIDWPTAEIVLSFFTILQLEQVSFGDQSKIGVSNNVEEKRRNDEQFGFPNAKKSYRSGNTTIRPPLPNRRILAPILVIGALYLAYYFYCVISLYRSHGTELCTHGACSSWRVDVPFSCVAAVLFFWKAAVGLEYGSIVQLDNMIYRSRVAPLAQWYVCALVKRNIEVFSHITLLHFFDPGEGETTPASHQIAYEAGATGNTIVFWLHVGGRIAGFYVVMWYLFWFQITSCMMVSGYLYFVIRTAFAKHILPPVLRYIHHSP